MDSQNSHIKQRPETPYVEIGYNNSNSDKQKENIFKNFSNLMKQIIDNQNENFLRGEINLIDYILAKYFNITHDEIEKLEKITIHVSSDYGLLNQFGERLIRLTHLKLDDSFIQSITDLGTSFRNLQILQINNCKLRDLSGLICYESLRILEAKNNQISELIELEMCSSLEKINLKGNLIEDEDNLYFISSLDKLNWLNLKDNPIKNYESKLRELMPGLTTIDDDSELDLKTTSPKIKAKKIERKEIKKEIKKETNNKPILKENDSDVINKDENIMKETELRKEKMISNAINTNQSISLTNTTNDNSQICQNGVRTKNGFYNKNINLDNQYLNEPLLSLKKDIDVNKSITDFGKSGLKKNHSSMHQGNLMSNITTPTTLKPVIMKKEESKDIKTLRESFQKTSRNEKDKNEEVVPNILLNTVTNKKKLDKIVKPIIKKDGSHLKSVLGQKNTKK